MSGPVIREDALHGSAVPDAATAVNSFAMLMREYDAFWLDVDVDNSTLERGVTLRTAQEEMMSLHRGVSHDLLSHFGEPAIVDEN